MPIFYQKTVLRANPGDLLWVLVFLLLITPPVFSQQNEVYRVGISGQLTPFLGSDTQGNPSGFSIDVFEAVAKRSGIQFQYVPLAGIDQARLLLSTGEVDILPLIFRSDNAAGNIHFSTPYAVHKNIAITRKLEYNAENFDASIRQIGLVENAWKLAKIDKYSAYNQILYTTLEEAFHALMRAEIDLLIHSEQGINYLVNNLGVNNQIKIVDKDINTVPLMMGFSGPLDETHHQIDVALQGYLNSDEYRELHQSWFNIQLPFWNTMKVFWAMSGLLVIVVIVMLFTRQRELIKLNNTLQSQIDDATSQLSKSNAYLRDLTVTDTLTGISNRRAFENTLHELISRASRYNDSFSMVIFDVDNFKSLNDGYGHDIGDQVLIDLVGRIKEIVRDVDVLSRWGGEEFTILMPKTTQAGAIKMAERCRQAVSDEMFDEVGQVTISLGATCFQQNDNERQFFKRADDALYQAKSLGKDRVVWVGDDCQIGP